MPVYHRGDVVLVRFPFTDLMGSALRPAVIISLGAIGSDIVLVAISSVIRGAVAPTDCLIEKTHPEFSLSGLKITSVIRVHKLATIETHIVSRRIGRLGPQLQAELD